MRTAAVKTLLKNELAFFKTLSRLFRPAQFVKCVVTEVNALFP